MLTLFPYLLFTRLKLTAGLIGNQSSSKSLGKESLKQVPALHHEILAQTDRNLDHRHKAIAGKKLFHLGGSSPLGSGLFGFAESRGTNPLDSGVSKA